MIKVVIADDHDVIREGVKRILDDTPDMRVVAEAADGQELLEKVRTKPCDVVLLDLTMSGRGGLETLRELKTGHPKLPILVLSMHAESQYAVRVLRAGAAGYLHKAHVSAQLVEAIRKVVGGGKYLTPETADALAVDLGVDSEQPIHKRLSDRELQVLCLFGSGKTVSGIAKELSLSVQTISTYRAHILEKMGLENNAQLTHYALQHHLVE
jgi:DNA-binding NarL/FixJ family response regulator